MKFIVNRLLVLLYLGALAISTLVLIKPGAGIFFIKKSVDNQAVVQDAGFSYRYKMDMSRLVIREQGILLFEDGQQLTPARPSNVANDGNGTYAIETSAEGATYLYFAPSDNSNPGTNGRAYRLYLPLTFVSRPMGIIYLMVLLPLVIRFFIFTMSDEGQRQTLTSSPRGIFRILDLFIDRSVKSIPAEIRQHWQDPSRRIFWKRLFTITILFAYLYIFMEWLFIVTMPSFMSLMSFLSKVEILLLSGWVFAIFCMVALAAFVIIDLLALMAQVHKITRYWCLFLPTLILSALVFLLIDNFTYTIFKFGVSTSAGIIRGAYGLLFVLLAAYIFYRMLRIFRNREGAQANQRPLNTWFYASVGILLITTGLALVNLKYSNIMPGSQNTEIRSSARLPNILLLGSDGVNADSLSVYGYDRDTTPRLKELAQSSLVAENAFTNASSTAGSVISIMTSKLPTQTRVMYPPDILTGINSYQHLPGLLKNLGYKTVEIGVPYYVDAYNYNLQNGFDSVNDRSQNVGKLGNFGLKVGFDNEVYFLYRITSRISDRLLHIFFIRELQNPYNLVTQPASFIGDQAKIDQTLGLLDEAQTPLFIHVHLLGTHGKFFAPEVSVFSQGETQSSPWMTDFYDDTLLSFDRKVGEVIDHLKADGQIDNTILIIYTDHRQAYKFDGRIPLIIHFPGGENAGEITRNVGNIDIAPTILDYLGIPKPKWMEGESILQENSSDRRLIFSADTRELITNEQGKVLIDPERNKPPFYQFSNIYVVDCQRIYILNLTSYQWSSKDVPGYVNPCSPLELLSMEQIKQATIDQLARDGFDTSSLR